MTTQFLPHLSRNFLKLLEDSKKHDFIINIDKDINKKEYRVHSIIIETRSTYVQDAISNGLARKENDIFILELPDISVDVFDILISYIYGGIIDLDKKDASDILNLLIACEIFKLKELYDYIQDYLINNYQDWLKQNFALIQQVGSKTSEFTKLQDYWSTTIRKEPKILFNAIDFTTVDKEALLSIYKDEELCMEENELWDRIIHWGKAQNTDFPEDIDKWTAKDFNVLKKTIDDFLPHIRFYEISSEDFCYKIMPYNSLLSNDLYQDLSRYHLVSSWTPKFNRLTPRRKNIPLDSKLINFEQAILISSWIQGNKDNKIQNKFKKNYYDFQLITRGSRDGFTGEIFHKMCDNKGPTITVLRLKNESSILGGYSPIDWDINKRGNFEKTLDSFIFSFIDKETILSRVKEPDNAIYQFDGSNFVDLQLNYTFNSKNGVYYSLRAYEKQIIQNEGNFVVDEYEVFSVTKKSG
ncbi:hypothetical protein RirG_257950 [Rhizophagus irregularis DAOM 197198w]|uniref:Serine-enriched protein n=1 Tax=Rhizophagus irregularis (strain DAOM 197198w) TaxID=1432141 RepID=A0A015LAL4_RHIIW|nr:hypothetical protein RirG_257950 [Rhizophagus irregularis DAOM 197198w]